ncbi:MAG: type II toxin-antitoxin system PemK/MazF family toxin [Candidatus Binatia bacterium]
MTTSGTTPTTPNTTACEFGDIVLVPFPFTDQTGSKKRPAAVVSSGTYHRAERDVILIAVTSRSGGGRRPLDVEISGWREAGLLKPSAIKPVIFTVERRLLLRRLGRLLSPDRRRLKSLLRKVLGD